MGESKCAACSCKDCQQREEYWPCPHFGGQNICEVCCRYDSTASDTNYAECATCPHDKDRI